MTDAETAAAFLLERLRAARGPLWDEGAARIASDGTASGPALQVVAARRLRGVPESVARGLLAWDRGQRPVDLCFAVPTAREVLARQARGRRYVCLLDDATARGHGDPRHPDGLTFLLHDLCHLEKFIAPEHHAGQVGFFRRVERALDAGPFAALQDNFDNAWRADRDYVISDMNGSAIFLFAALKMKLNMAVRRQLAAAGRPAPAGGPLTPDERAAAAPALTTLLQAMGLPDALHAGAHAVSTRRDSPAEARRLLDDFEAEGAATPGTMA
ncbi:MAG TPA: hypothetical protein VH374_14560 [Polyangia bacterium]|jgi:hypothetical protein|nr:hypothetical protein [Polyangia bacterium]